LGAVSALLLATGCPEYDFAVFEGVDVFFQNPSPEVDVLLVIDNSGSMYGYQILVGARFDEFLTYFTEVGVDYHIGVVTTTLDEVYPFGDCTQEDIDAIPEPGHLHLDTIITPETVNADELFDDLVKVGACGSGYEQGLEAARLALEPEMLSGPNLGLIRGNATLSIVFVSDEQDQSFEPVHHYTNAFYEVKGNRSRDVFNASALVVTDADDCLLPVAGSSVGSRYMAIAEQTGGIVSNLCNTNFALTMAEISFNASRMRDTFTLSGMPDVPSLQVSVDERVIPCGAGEWTYQLLVEGEEEEPVIVFDRDHLPRPDTQIAVRYNYGNGDPETFCTGVEEEE
jgi:hypothetical protein